MVSIPFISSIIKVKILNRLTYKTFPDTYITEDYSNTKLNDNTSDPTKKDKYMYEYQIHGLATKIEILKYLSKNNPILLKKYWWHYQPIRSKTFWILNHQSCNKKICEDGDYRDLIKQTPWDKQKMSCWNFLQLTTERPYQNVVDDAIYLVVRLLQFTKQKNNFWQRKWKVKKNNKSEKK